MKEPNTKRSVLYEALNQIIRPYADAIELCWHEIYKDYEDEENEKPIREYSLSDILDFASTVAFEEEVERKYGKDC